MVNTALPAITVYDQPEDTKPQTIDGPIGPENLPQNPEFNAAPIISEPEKPFEVDTSRDVMPAPSSLETVEKRSAKVKYGLGDILQKTKDEIYGDLAQGNELDLREKASGIIDSRKSAALESLIKQTTERKGAPLTAEEAAGLTTIIMDMTKQTDPATVFEQAYAKQFISTLDKVAEAKPDRFLNDAKQKFPEQTAKILDNHVEHTTKREILTTYLEDVEDDIKGQGWPGWLVDQAKSFVPGYTDIKLRGNVGKVGVFSGGGLGQNLENQELDLWRMPKEKLKEEITRIIEPMRKDNPTLAAQFLRNMIGMSNDDVVLNNVILPLDLAGLGIGKATVKGVRKLLPKSDAQLLKDTEKASRDMARAAADPEISKSGIEAAAGDLEQAAITQATTNAIGDVKGLPRPTQRGIEALSNAHRVDIADARKNPGRHGQDIVNRLEEQTISTVESVLAVAQKVSKIEGLPEVMSNETAVRAIIDDMKQKYTSLRNTVIDVLPPYKERLTGRWFVDFHVGNADGTYFTQRSVAENFLTFHGLSGNEIIPGTSIANTKAGKKVASIQGSLDTANDTVRKIEKRLEENKYGSVERENRDRETLEFLTKEAIPSYKARLEEAVTQKATVEQQGLGFYIRITKPITETDDVVRDVIASTKNTRIPENNVSAFVNAWIGKYRTPEDTLSKAERQNRLIATYTPSEIFKVLIDNSTSINKLATTKPARFSKGRQKWDDFQRVLENGQELWDAQTKQKGYFFKSPGELEEAYMSWFKRMPDEDEILAYFEFKRLMEVDRAFRNVAEHSAQTRLGAETHKVIATTGDGTIMPSPEFSGITRSKMASGDFNVAIIDSRYGFEKVRNLGTMSTKERGEFQKLIDSGDYKHLEIYNPDLRPLKGYGAIGDNPVRYVLAKQTEVRELDWNHVPRRGGGHVEYDHPYYIKQAKVKEDSVGGFNWYEGDTTIMPMVNHKMAQDVAAKLDKVRQFLLDKNENAARDYSNQNLHIEWDTVKGWFQGERDATGKWSGARLSLKEPIQVVERNKSIVGMSDELEKRYPNFRNGEKEGNLARQNKVAFTEERDAHDVFTLENKGTARDPLYSVAQADKVDPITSLNRGLTRIAKSNFLDAYKTMAVEHWLQQASTHLKASESELRHSPFYYFKEAAFRPDADVNAVAQLEAAKAHILQLVQQPSETASKLHLISQKLADGAYDKLGPNSVLTPEWDLSGLRDPFRVARTIVYHQAMGLWNIPQFIVQAGNYSNILGIAGIRYATPGTLGAQVHFWSRMNSRPEMIDFWDNVVSKFHIPGTSRYKPGEFKEAFEEFHKTGFGNVGGEFAALDDPMNHQMIITAGQKVLDSSGFFVRNGERNSRYGAWYTAMKEFRDVNPTGRITDADRAAILQRADLLNINMSRASSSALHSGMMSIPTQFYTYQIRLTELFASNRLTGPEKRRMLFTNSLLYGIPMGMGLSGLPFAGLIREKMMENGYVVGDNFFSSAAMEGLVSALGAIATGKGDPQGGTWFDVGERFGTKGFEFIGSINRSDKNFLDVLGGPAWALAKSTVEQTSGFWRVMGNLVREDENDLFPPTAHDFLDPLKVISSVNNIGFRTYAAIQYNRWQSKNEAWLADTDAFKGIIAAATSLKDQRINDLQTFKHLAEAQKDIEKFIEKHFMEEYRRGVLGDKDNDPEASKKAFTRAKVWLHRMGYPEDRITELANKASRENQSVLDKATFEFYKKQPTQAKKDMGMDALRRTERVKAKQRGDE